MEFESKRVHCGYCDGIGKDSTPFRSVNEELRAGQTDCAECEGTGQMEVRRKAGSGWASCCPHCGGKGFKDAWNPQYEEHDTVDCVDCQGTGGIPYPLTSR